MKTLLTILVLSNIATVVVAFRSIDNIEESHEKDFKKIENKLDLIDKDNYTDRETLENGLKEIKSKQLTQTEVKEAVVEELRKEVTKLAFIPIRVNLK